MHIESQALDKELAGQVGRELADALSAKCIDTIEGYPAPEETRMAIARIVSRRLREWVEESR